MEEEILNRIVSVIESEDMTSNEVRIVINAIHHSQPALMEFLEVCRDDVMGEAALHGVDAGIASDAALERMAADVTDRVNILECVREGHAVMWQAIEKETEEKSVLWATEHGFMRAEPAEEEKKMEQKTVDRIARMIMGEKSMTESDAAKILRALSEKGLIRGSLIIWDSDIKEAARMAAIHADVGDDDLQAVMEKVASMMNGESYIEEGASTVDLCMQDEADFLAEWTVSHGEQSHDMKEREER